MLRKNNALWLAVPIPMTILTNHSALFHISKARFTPAKFVYSDLNRRNLVFGSNAFQEEVSKQNQLKEKKSTWRRRRLNGSLWSSLLKSIFTANSLKRDYANSLWYSLIKCWKGTKGLWFAVLKTMFLTYSLTAKTGSNQAPRHCLNHFLMKSEVDEWEVSSCQHFLLSCFNSLH